MSTFEHRLGSVLEEAGFTPDRHPDVQLGDLDSLAILEVINLLEESIGRPIAPGVFDASTTVADIVRFDEAVAGRN
jgi:acyl carrier protein